ncbi:hypothetical protein ACFV6D_21350 [Kitasatospora sp. NPDC059812]
MAFTRLYRATLNPSYCRAIDWAATTIKATDGVYTGVSFYRNDTKKVWFEGTGHLLVAYHARANGTDPVEANKLLTTLETAQTSAPNTDGSGIVAASGDSLDTGQGDYYYAALHTGATAWYVIAAQGGNPFRL